MRKLFNEFFYIPQHGKVKEKVMLVRTAITVIIMIACLAAMSITAYAYFSYNVTSGSNIIKAATFETQVKVQITDANGVAVENSQIIPITSDHRNFEIRGLEVGKYYTITITPTKQSTAKTGFVVVTADGCKETYHTQQLAKDVNAKGGQTTSLSFKLMITDTTDVVLEAHWGTSSYYDAYKDKGGQEKLYITQDEKIKLIIGGKDISKYDDGMSDKGILETTPPITETQTTEPTTTETTTPSEENETVETQPQATTETESVEETTDAPPPR